MQIPQRKTSSKFPPFNPFKAKAEFPIKKIVFFQLRATHNLRGINRHLPLNLCGAAQLNLTASGFGLVSTLQLRTLSYLHRVNRHLSHILFGAAQLIFAALPLGIQTVLALFRTKCVKEYVALLVYPVQIRQRPKHEYLKFRSLYSFRGHGCGIYWVS